MFFKDLVIITNIEYFLTLFLFQSAARLSICTPNLFVCLFHVAFNLKVLKELVEKNVATVLGHSVYMYVCIDA